jgi:hypothetical protein
MTDDLRRALEEYEPSGTHRDAFEDGWRAALAACSEPRAEGLREAVENAWEALLAVEKAAYAATPPAEGLVSKSAYDLALVQIEHDGEVINRLTQALRVANHKPHDRDGEPDPESGFPTCSECGAILTAATPPAEGLDATWVQSVIDRWDGYNGDSLLAELHATPAAPEQPYDAFPEFAPEQPE